MNLNRKLPLTLSALLTSCFFPITIKAQEVENYTFYRAGVGYANVPGTTRLSVALDATSPGQFVHSNEENLPERCFEGNGITHFTPELKVRSFVQFGNAMGVFAARGLETKFYCGDEPAQPRLYVEVSQDGEEWSILNDEADIILNHYLLMAVKYAFDKPSNDVARHSSGGVSLKRRGELEFILSIVGNRYGFAVPAENIDHQRSFLQLVGYTSFESQALEGAPWATHGTLVWLGEVDQEDFFGSLRRNLLVASNLNLANQQIHIQQLEHGFGDPVRDDWLLQIYQNYF